MLIRSLGLQLPSTLLILLHNPGLFEMRDAGCGDSPALTNGFSLGKGFVPWRFLTKTLSASILN